MQASELFIPCFDNVTSPRPTLHKHFVVRPAAAGCGSYGSQPLGRDSASSKASQAATLPKQKEETLSPFFLYRV